MNDSFVKPKPVKITLVVIAASWKSSGFWVAGRELMDHNVTKRFIRLVSNEDGDELSEPQIMISDDKDGELFDRIVEPRDVIIVSLYDYEENVQQPENRIIADEPWFFVEKFKGDVRYLVDGKSNLWKQHKYSFEDWRYGLCYDSAVNVSNDDNLERTIDIIRPRSLQFYRRELKCKSGTLKTLCFAIFIYKGVRYEMHVIDANIKKQIPAGNIAPLYFGDNCLVCVALGMPYSDGKRYLFVASVIELEKNS